MFVILGKLKIKIKRRHRSLTSCCCFMVVLWLLMGHVKFAMQQDKLFLKWILKERWWPWIQPNHQRNGYRRKLVSVSGLEPLPGLKSCGLNERNHPHAQTYEYQQAWIQTHSTDESFHKCVQSCFRMSTGNLCWGFLFISVKGANILDEDIFTAQLCVTCMTSHKVRPWVMSWSSFASLRAEVCLGQQLVFCANSIKWLRPAVWPPCVTAWSPTDGPSVEKYSEHREHPARTPKYRRKSLFIRETGCVPGAFWFLFVV